MKFDELVFETLRFLLSFIPEFTLSSLLWNVFFSFVALTLMIMFHEYGHLATLNHYLKKETAKINWGFKNVEVGTQKQINSLNQEQYLIVMGVGVGIGFLPLVIIAGAGLIEQFFQGLIFSAYLIASSSDLKVIIKSIRKKKKNEGMD